MIKFISFSLLAYFLIGSGLYFSQRKLTFNKSAKPDKPLDYDLKNVTEEIIELVFNA